MVSILKLFLSQMIFTVGIIVLFGWLISLCRGLFSRLLGDRARVFMLVSGVVGTPIHELSHALMCIIFGHRITDISLYQLADDEGTLGYVRHSYNPRNIYHQIGNFFIGVAPIIGGSAVLLLLMKYLVPGIYGEARLELEAISSLSGFDIGRIAELLLNIMKEIFNFSYISDYKWWIFIILALMISCHMELSGADIKGSVLGFVYIAVIALAADTVLGLVSFGKLVYVTEVITSIALYITAFLLISLVFSLIQLLFGILLRILGVGR